ncbi:hypothetical protein HKD37_U058297 [Glycine soja]
MLLRGVYADLPRAPASWLVEIWVHGRLRRDKMVDEPRSRPITCEPVSSGPIDDPLRATLRLPTRPQVRRGYPLSLSISISGGKETNKDSLSNGRAEGKEKAHHENQVALPRRQNYESGGRRPQVADPGPRTPPTGAERKGAGRSLPGTPVAPREALVGPKSRVV